MATVVLDTLNFANRLKTAGVPAAQAEVEAQALAEALQAQAQALQADMDARFGRDLTQNELRADGAIARLESKMDARFAAMQTQIDARFAAVDLRFAQLESKMDKGFTDAHGKFTLLQWMLGSLIALSLAIAVKLFI